MVQSFGTDKDLNIVEIVNLSFPLQTEMINEQEVHLGEQRIPLRGFGVCKPTREVVGFNSPTL